MSKYRGNGDDWWIVWGILLLLPLILFFGLIFLVDILNIFLNYIEFIQSITGFKNKSFSLLIAIFTPFLITIYLINRLFQRFDKNQKDTILQPDTKIEEWEMIPCQQGYGNLHYITVYNDNIKQGLSSTEQLYGKIIEFRQKADGSYIVKFKRGFMYKIKKC